MILSLQYIPCTKIVMITKNIHHSCDNFFKLQRAPRWPHLRFPSTVVGAIQAALLCSMHYTPGEDMDELSKVEAMIHLIGR